MKMKSKNRIRLSESQLHKVIKESVKNVLNELDWGTYDSAMRKAAARGDYERAGRFGSASRDAYNRDYGTHGSVYDYNYRRETVPYQTRMIPKDGDVDGEWIPDGTDSNNGWYDDSISAASDSAMYPDSLEVIPGDEFSIRRNMRNQIETRRGRNNNGNVWADDSSLADARQAARRGLKVTQDYLTGKRKYHKGEGWK